MNSHLPSKDKARLFAKIARAQCHDPAAGVELIKHFPALKFRGLSVAGYWPLPGEMDVRPLLGALVEAGHDVSLPCITKLGEPLKFRVWTKGDKMRLGAYSLREPYQNQPEMTPQLVLLPLLAFTSEGKRLGYGGGYYDRTLEMLRRKGDVFACGVAYAGQETRELPTDEHDQPLDGILTERYFKVF